MLAKSDLQVLSKVFGKTEEEISGAISAEQETPLDLRLNGKVYTQQEIDDMKKTLTDAGVEIGIKNVAKIANIQLDPGEKKPEVIIQKITENITSTLEEKFKNQEPGEELVKAIEKQKEWEQKHNKLLETYESTKKETEEWQKKYDTVLKDNEQKLLDDRFRKAFPDKMRIDIPDALLVARHELVVEKTEEGKEVVKRNGEVVLGPTGEPETLDNVMKIYVEDKKWIKSNGMGGGDRGGAGGSTIPTGMTAEQAMKYLEEKGVEPMSTKGSEMFVQLTKKV